MQQDLAAEFINECKNQFRDSYNRLFHCLDQLNDEQTQWRPNEKMNSVSILVKHVCGNMQQWTVDAMNNAESRRNRPQEFVIETELKKSGLVSLARELETNFMDALDRLDTARLTEQRRIQGSEVTLMGAIFHALTHLEGHIGEIVLLTRIQFGADYKVFWLPQTDEQKAAWTAG